MQEICLPLSYMTICTDSSTANVFLPTICVSSDHALINLLRVFSFGIIVLMVRKSSSKNSSPSTSPAKHMTNTTISYLFPSAFSEVMVEKSHEKAGLPLKASMSSSNEFSFRNWMTCSFVESFVS